MDAILVFITIVHFYSYALHTLVHGENEFCVLMTSRLLKPVSHFGERVTPLNLQPMLPREAVYTETTKGPVSFWSNWTRT